MSYDDIFWNYRASIIVSIAYFCSAKNAVEFRVRWADKMQFKMASTVDTAWVLFYGVTRLHKSNYSVVPASYQ